MKILSSFCPLRQVISEEHVGVFVPHLEEIWIHISKQLLPLLLAQLPLLLWTEKSTACITCRKAAVVGTWKLGHVRRRDELEEEDTEQWNCLSIVVIIIFKPTGHNTHFWEVKKIIKKKCSFVSLAFTPNSDNRDILKIGIYSFWKKVQ